MSDNGTIRQFESGAIRDTDNGKFDYEGFMHPAVVERFAAYMHKHRTLADGSLRDSDNWQNGFPRDVLMKSAFRHFVDWWKEHRGLESREGIEDAICGLIFNANAYLLSCVKTPIHVDKCGEKDTSDDADPDKHLCKDCAHRAITRGDSTHWYICDLSGTPIPDDDRPEYCHEFKARRRRK